MNSKTFFPLVAVLALFLVGFASASLTDLNSPMGGYVSLNDVALSPGTSTVIAGNPGETIPVRVVFSALQDASDVKVKVTIEGFRNDISSSTTRFDLVSGSIYSKLLALQLPSDINDLTTDYTIYVSVISPTERDEQVFTVKLQRDSYSLNAVSVDFDNEVSAGQTVPVNVVIENDGFHTLDNGFVEVSIASLGVSARAYLGDLTPLDNCTDGCNTQDAIEKTLYLKIPSTANAGVYDLTVRAYNKEVTMTTKKVIRVSGSATTTVLATVKTQDIPAGSTKSYDLVLVNSGNSIKVYNIQVVSGSALSVSAPTVVTVGPQSSASVPLTVTASETADLGSYTFSVIVDGQQTVYGANIVSGGAISTSVVALTVILVIIFVVLLIVLIVLLTRKEKPTEEVETSYY